MRARTACDPSGARRRARTSGSIRSRPRTRLRRSTENEASRQLVRYANALLRDRVLFGSDYPLITPDRWLADFAEADFKDEVRPLILNENAARMLGL